MIPTAIIAFREFLEAFLIIGVFLGISRRLHLKREIEIGIAAIVGVSITFLVTTGTYFFGDTARTILTEENAEMLESYLLIFSGVFIAYVVFSLHDMMKKDRGAKLIQAHKKLQNNTFDLSLFFTIVFLIIREGFEIALFTASVSLFSDFMQNVAGLFLGFATASILSILLFFAYIKFPVGQVFKWTQYVIMLLGAVFVQRGITELLETSFNIHISDMLSFHLQFLPGEDTFLGHLLQGLLGIDQEFSILRLAIMGIYIGCIYLLFMKRDHKPLDLSKEST